MSELQPSPPPSKRPRKFNTKIIMGIMATVVIVIVLVVALSMMLGNLGEGGARNNIGTKAEAYRVALIVRYAATTVASPETSALWNNERVDGYFSGYAIVDGSFEKTRYMSGWNERITRTYNDVEIQFYDYCNWAMHADELHPHLTGDATISGSTYYREGDYPEDTGGWILTGSLTLSHDYSCSITFAMEIRSYGWVGTITSDGTTWQVSSS